MEYGVNGKICVQKNDLINRFEPIQINGYKGDTFYNVLRNNYNGEVRFIMFSSSKENLISDNPFSFTNGYGVAFNKSFIDYPNIFSLIGISADNQSLVEARRIDLR